MQSTENATETRSSDALRDGFAEALQGDVYACTRVWEGWQYGTMTEDDFTPAWEDDGVLENLVEVAATAIAAERDRADRAEARIANAVAFWVGPDSLPESVAAGKMHAALVAESEATA